MRSLHSKLQNTTSIVELVYSYTKANNANERMRLVYRALDMDLVLQCTLFS